jgi:uncharacterized glyoxalase superfamily protein PhnB
MYSVNKVEVILTVPSIEETQAWYARVLGWEGHCDVHDEGGRCAFGCVIRGELDAMADGRPLTGFNLSRYGGDVPYCRDPGHCTLFVQVDDVDEVYARAVESGVPIDAPLEAQPWGGMTFSLYDLNGFHLTLYQLEAG